MTGERGDSTGPRGFPPAQASRAGRRRISDSPSHTGPVADQLIVGKVVLAPFVPPELRRVGAARFAALVARVAMVGWAWGVGVIAVRWSDDPNRVAGAVEVMTVVGAALAVGWFAAGACWSVTRTLNVYRLDGRYPSIGRAVRSWLYAPIWVAVMTATLVRLEAHPDFDVRPSIIVVGFVLAMLAPYRLVQRIFRSLVRVQPDAAVFVLYIVDAIGIGVIWWRLSTWPDPAAAVDRPTVDLLGGSTFAAGVALFIGLVLWVYLDREAGRAEGTRVLALRTRHDHRLARLQGLDPMDRATRWALWLARQAVDNQLASRIGPAAVDQHGSLDLPVAPTLPDPWSGESAASQTGRTHDATAPLASDPTMPYLPAVAADATSGPVADLGEASRDRPGEVDAIAPAVDAPEHSADPGQRSPEEEDADDSEAPSSAASLRERVLRAVARLDSEAVDGAEVTGGVSSDSADLGADRGAVVEPPVVQSELVLPDVAEPPLAAPSSHESAAVVEPAVVQSELAPPEVAQPPRAAPSPDEAAAVVRSELAPPEVAPPPSAAPSPDEAAAEADPAGAVLSALQRRLQESEATPSRRGVSRTPRSADVDSLARVLQRRLAQSEQGAEPTAPRRSSAPLARSSDQPPISAVVERLASRLGADLERGGGSEFAARVRELSEQYQHQPSAADPPTLEADEPATASLPLDGEPPRLMLVELCRLLALVLLAVVAAALVRLLVGAARHSGDPAANIDAMETARSIAVQALGLGYVFVLGWLTSAARVVRRIEPAVRLWPFAMLTGVAAITMISAIVVEFGAAEAWSHGALLLAGAACVAGLRLMSNPIRMLGLPTGAVTMWALTVVAVQLILWSGPLLSPLTTDLASDELAFAVIVVGLTTLTTAVLGALMMSRFEDALRASPVLAEHGRTFRSAPDRRRSSP